MYLYCMLELLTGEASTAKAEQIYHLLRWLNESYEMLWFREATITILIFWREWGQRTVIEVAEWPSCLGDPDLVCPADVVMSLLPEWAVDRYDNCLFLACQVAWEMAYFVYYLTNHYGLPF